MTACAVWAERLVVAAPEELSGMVETELSRHIRDCRRCAAETHKIAAANEALRVAVSSPEVDAAELIDRARHAEADEQRTTVQRLARAPRIVWSAMAASVAAAAVIAVLLLRMPTLEPLPLPVRPLALVDAGDHNLVVMPTRNPDITILWFYKETEE